MSFSNAKLRGSLKVIVAVCCYIFLSSSLASAIIKDYTTSPLPTSDPVLTEALDLINKGDPKSSLEIVNVYIQNNPNSAIAYEIRGIAYAKLGNLNKGKASLQTAISLNPKQATAYVKLADISLFEGNVANAKELLRTAISHDPKLSRAHQRLGVIFEEERKIEQAINHYEQGLIGVPNNYLGVRLNLAFLYNRVSKPQFAVSLLEPWSEDKKSNLLVHRALGNAFLALNKSQRAIMSYNAAIALDPKDTLLLIGLGAAYKQAENNEAAITTYREAIEVDSASSTAYFQLSLLLTDSKEYDEALMNLKLASQHSSSPRNLEPYLSRAYANTGQMEEAADIFKGRLDVSEPSLLDFTGLGMTYQQFSEFDKAEEVFKKQIAAFSTSVEGYYRLGSLYGLQQKYTEAAATYDRGLETSPDNIVLLKGNSLSNLRLGNRNHAIRLAEKIVSLVPESARDNFFLATLYEGDRQFEKAITIYREIILKAPNHAFSMNNLAVLLVETGDEDEALQLAKKAVELASGNGIVQHTLGRVLYSHKKYKEAIDTLEHASKLLPNKPVIRYDLARSYRAIGQIDRAKSELRAALDMPTPFADSDDAKALLEKL